MTKYTDEQRKIIKRNLEELVDVCHLAIADIDIRPGADDLDDLLHDIQDKAEEIKDGI
jgi:hypothetical protein